jgi:hypothetical protein
VRLKNPGGAGVVYPVFMGAALIALGAAHVRDPGHLVDVILFVSLGLLYLAAGVLVLLGRKKYLAWKAEQLP